MKILVVDDETMMVESIKIGLLSKGYSVVGVNSALQALDLLSGEGHDFDLVLTDYLMPITNGIDLLMAIRRMDLTLPVLIMTAYADTSLVIDALKNGCVGFVEKPFSRDQLVAEIKRIEQLIPQDSSEQ